MSELSRMLRAELAASPAVVVGALTLLVCLLLAGQGGGVDTNVWAQYGILLALALGLALAFVGREHRPWTTASAGALAAFVAFAGWNVLSIAWAGSRSTALVGSSQTILAVLAFALVFIWPWTARGRLVFLGVLASGIAVLAAIAVARMGLSAHPRRLFDADGRLIWPIGYANGNAALWMLGLWSALLLAWQRRAPVVVRGLALAAATLLLEVALLAQSRAWLVAAPATALVLLVLVRSRLRAALALLLAAAPLAATLLPLLAVLDHGADRHHVRVAAVAVLLGALGAAVAGAAWALADRRIRLSERTTRTVGRVAVAVAVSAALVGVVVGLSTVDDPTRWISHRWNSFTQQTYPAPGQIRFGSLGSHRYEEWSVEWHEFVRHPLLGTGSNNFEHPWLLHRTDPTKDTDTPHSWLLRLLGELGIVGAALFLVALGCCVVLYRAGRAGARTAEADARAVAATTFAYWAIHGAVDWFWEIPGLLAIAFVCLALASGARAETPARAARARRALPRAAMRGAIGGTLVAIVAVFGAQWASFAYQQAGLRVWSRAHPDASYARLDRAAALDPLDAFPLLVKGALALERGDLALSTRSFERARRREPESWYASFELAALAASQGRYAEARSDIAVARALNPRDPRLVLLARAISKRDRVDPIVFNALFQPGREAFSP